MNISSGGSTLPNVLSAQGEAGFQLRVSQGRVVLATLPTWIDYWSPIQIDLGTAAGTVATRFAGYVVDFNYELFPRAVTLECRGSLYKAQLVPPQLDAAAPDDAAFPGIALAGLTDDQQVRSVLDGSGMGGDYTPGDIGGMAYLLGTATSLDAKGAQSVFVWKRQQPGLDYIQALDEASYGFRTFQDLDGRVRRQRVEGRPSLNAAALTFGEGTDLYRASATHSTSAAANRAVVLGFDNGTGAVRGEATAGHPHPPLGVQWVSTYFRSPLIEKARASDPGDGLSAEGKAAQLVADRNHVLLTTEHVTPRDDVVSPGDTVGILSDDRLQIYQNQWVQYVAARVGADGGFTQTIRTRAPAAVGRGGTPFVVTLGARAGLGPRG